ncbi:MAG: transposase, partial [Aggregatilineales bacterium]
DIWVLKRGVSWCDRPERYGKVGTVGSRFYGWVEAGVWQRVVGGLGSQADAAGELDWELPMRDGSVVGANQHSAGAKK